MYNETMFKEDTKYILLEGCVNGIQDGLSALYHAVDQYDWNYTDTLRVEPNYKILSYIAEAERVPADPEDGQEIRYTLNNFRRARTLLLSYELDSHLKKMLDDITKLFETYYYIKKQLR